MFSKGNGRVSESTSQANNLPNLLLTCSRFLSLHCQIVITCQPKRLSAAPALASLLLFFAILWFQKAALSEAGFPLLQFRCPCQKHPLTNKAVLAEVIVKSGLPGRDETFRRYRNPSSFSNIATASSGAVRLFLTRDIISLRLALLKMSAI